MLNSKNSKKRFESTKKYIDKLQENNSKLNVIRLDLAYKKPHSNDVTLEEATKDIERMFNNRRSNSIFQDQVGYVCKKEYTKEKGIHFHTYFFFDGQKIQKSSFKAKQIGELWDNNITRGKGSHHNCHLNEYINNGIGMLEHTDEEKRKNLDDAISYLCKDEQDIEPLKTNKKERAFTRGTLPRSKGNVGRPRIK